MFQIKADFKNKKVLLKTKKMDQLTIKGIRKGFYDLGRDLKKDAIRLINKKPKSGRIYLIRKNGVLIPHQASAPGEAPAVITGRLRKSVDFLVSGGNNMIFGARRSFNMRSQLKGTDFTMKGTRQHVIEYPKYLEDGTNKMKARPYLLPAIKNNYRNARVAFKNQINKSIKEGK
jgi:hypothetical protein